MLRAAQLAALALTLAAAACRTPCDEPRASCVCGPSSGTVACADGVVIGCVCPVCVSGAVRPCTTDAGAAGSEPCELGRWSGLCLERTDGP